MTIDLDALRTVLTRVVLDPGFRRAVFGGPRRGVASYPWRRVHLRPVRVQGERRIQFSFFDARKHIAKNYAPDEVAARLGEVLDAGFAAIQATTGEERINARTTKKGRVLMSRRRVKEPASAPSLEHNRAKEAMLPAGDRFLATMGILTRAGVVRPAMRPKYAQINELLKQLTHVLDDAGLRSLGRPVEILDCGCGSSHLTLATHHYLNDILGLPARILGVDVNDELIRKSIERSRRMGLNVEFACTPIGAAQAAADIVLALHACDTATDEAIGRAIAAGARVLLSVPCCHHHLNEQIRAQGPAETLRPLLRHGILRQRTADLVTDAFRALALRIMGYKTDVVEFISPEHTSRNLMIRAVRGADLAGEAHVREYQELRRFWQAAPYIETTLGAAFREIVASQPISA